MKFTPIAVTWTNASFSLGLGAATSASFKTSGPPVFAIWMAFIIPSDEPQPPPTQLFFCKKQPEARSFGRWETPAFALPRKRGIMKHDLNHTGRYSAFAVAALAALTLTFVLALESKVSAGQAPTRSGYQVLAPITHGNLTIFPVIASSVHDANFLTLDEGLR